ncbi:MAG: phosphoglycerate kinase, partial [Alphaproteobacteria bacterium]|nr:phosphoglycerate kinase [Alphaproteobacteria bacterium]
MSFKTLKDLDLQNKTVLLRVDLNVPVDEAKNVTDMTRIERVKPTIDYLREHQAKIIILTHFGRPKGEVKPELSLEFLAPVLTQKWECDVRFEKEPSHDIGRN